MKHVVVQFYLEYNHEVSHARTNDITDKLTDGKWVLPFGKSSHVGSGVIFSGTFLRSQGIQEGFEP